MGMKRKWQTGYGVVWYSRVGVKRSRWENEDEGRYLCCRRRISFGALKGLNLKVPTPYNRAHYTHMRLLVYEYERAFSLCAWLCTETSLRASW